MGFRWRKSFKIFPGFRLNLSHRGARGQLGGSPLSFSFRLFGGSKARRLTASVPGTGLSFVTESAPAGQPPHIEQSHGATNYHALLREALTQAGQMRLIPIKFDHLPDAPTDVQREILKAAIPRLTMLLLANGAKRTGPALGPEVIDEFSDEKVAALLIETRTQTAASQ